VTAPGREHLLSLVRRDASAPRQYTYHAIRELLLRSPATASHLSAFELKVFSQNGEDGIIAEITRRLGVETGYFVEFGIESGAEGNCIFLANVLGWPGLFVEGDPGLFAELSRKYRSKPVLLVEFWPRGIDELGDRPVDVLSYYRSLGFSVSQLSSPGSDPGWTADTHLVQIIRDSESGFATIVLTPSSGRR